MAALVAAVLLATGGVRSASAKGVTFDSVNPPFAEVLSKAKSLDATRFVVVELFTENCAWCGALERETFGVDEVAAALKDDLCVRFDADSDAGKPVAARFGVRSYPTTLFLDPAGAEVDRLAGFVPAPRFVDEVARMRAGTRTLKTLRAAHVARPDDAGVRVAFARKLVRTGERDAARLLLDPVAAASEPDVAALPGALLGLAEIANLEGDARRVDEYLTRLLTQFPDAPEAADGWILKIDRLALVGAFDLAAQAAAEARRVVKGDEALARLEERLATFERLKFQSTLLRWGERADASGDLESLARAAKMALDRRLVLGTARRWAERVAKAAPDDVDAVEVYAGLLFETGSMEKAIRTATEALDSTKDVDVRARLSRRIAVWRAALDGPSPPSTPATPAAPASDPESDEGRPRPGPGAHPSDPDALPRPPGDRVPPPVPPPTPTSPTGPKPPCR